MHAIVRTRPALFPSSTNDFEDDDSCSSKILYIREVSTNLFEERREKEINVLRLKTNERTTVCVFNLPSIF